MVDAESIARYVEVAARAHALRARARATATNRTATATPAAATATPAAATPSVAPPSVAYARSVVGQLGLRPGATVVTQPRASPRRAVALSVHSSAHGSMGGVGAAWPSWAAHARDTSLSSSFHRLSGAAAERAGFRLPPESYGGLRVKAG